jgi:pimeloyl-ACP methyl ester carboxylesterase
MTAGDHLGGPIAWREAGGGQPVLLLHGLGGTRLAWEPQLEGLADRFRCIAWDMPGYGGSAALTTLTFPGVVDAIVRLLDTLGIDRVDVVGLSMGGQHAQHLAIAHPERIRRLVLADTSYRFGADGTDPEAWKRLRLDALDAGLTPADIAARVLDSITAPGFGGGERQRLIDAFSAISSDGLRAAVEMLPTHAVDDRLAEIAAPTLVIVGELDEETPLAYAEYLAGHIPGAHLEVIAGAGHLTPSEAPDDFNRLIAEFLA